MPFVAAVSQHPVLAHAVGEVTGRVLEHLGPAPDLVVLFVGVESAGAIEEIVGAVRRLLRPVALAGCTASSVIGDEVEVVDGGLAVLAGSGFDAALTRGVEPGAAFVLADPFSVRADGVFYASAGRGPGGNRLVLDDELHDDGAVSVTLDRVRTSRCSGRPHDLIETAPPDVHAALAFVGEGRREVAVALAESVRAAPLAGIRVGGSPANTATLVSFTVADALGVGG